MSYWFQEVVEFITAPLEAIGTGVGVFESGAVEGLGGIGTGVGVFETTVAEGAAQAGAAIQRTLWESIRPYVPWIIGGLAVAVVGGGYAAAKFTPQGRAASAAVRRIRRR